MHDPATSHAVGANRWLRAVVVSLFIAAWPACAIDYDQAPPAAANTARLDFTLKDMNGNDVRLSEFKGRPLLINFWATWCAPCKHEIPAFIELVDKYRDQKFTVLGISTDDSPEDLRKFAAEFKMNYPVLVGLGREDLMETYDAAIEIPVTWFVKADGTVHLKHKGTQSKEWFEKQVKALF